MIANQAEKNLRVLIVDDDPDLAKLFGMLLQKNGYVVETTTDSTQCLSRLELFNPDVVFLDIAMPKLSGYDLARNIREKPKFERVPIIALSGYGDSEHVGRSIEAGCNRHLVKPVGIATFHAVIRQEVEKRLQTASYVEQLP